jgi:hypothetical protein
MRTRTFAIIVDGHQSEVAHAKHVRDGSQTLGLWYVTVAYRAQVLLKYNSFVVLHVRCVS